MSESDKCPYCDGDGWFDTGGQNPDGSWIRDSCAYCTLRRQLAQRDEELRGASKKARWYEGQLVELREQSRVEREMVRTNWERSERWRDRAETAEAACAALAEAVRKATTAEEFADMAYKIAADVTNPGQPILDRLAAAEAENVRLGEKLRGRQSIKDVPTTAITGLTLAALANQYSGAEHDELWRRMTALVSEVERLRAVVERLPLFADGQPAAIGAPCFACFEDIWGATSGRFKGLICEGVVIGYTEVRFASPLIGYLRITDVYSTRAAAEAAKEAKKP